MSSLSTTSVFPSTIRSIAVLSDIHGNIRALEAVLDDIAREEVGAVACNGDLVTGSVHTAQVVRRIRSLGIPCTRGNHERYLSELADPDHEKWGQANWAPAHHDYHMLEPDERQWLSTLPQVVWLCDGDAPLLMAHASPSSDVVAITANQSQDAWQGLFRDLPEGTTLVGSHLHWFWQHRWMNYRFIRTPSVGLPLDGDTRAGYVILRRDRDHWRVEQRRLVYDLDGELRAFREHEYYEEGGAIAKLFWEELRTARSWILPFFAHVKEAASADAAPISASEFEQHLVTFDRDTYPEYRPDAPRNPR